MRTLLGVMPLLCVLMTSAQAEKPPPLLWSVSDEALSMPLGAIADVAVGPDGTVFMLDTQNWAVRRLSAEGHELPPLGRRGEGPGEFLHPRLLAALSNGGCVVIQDFYAPAVCFAGEGDRLCTAPDVSGLRTRFKTILMGTARIDTNGRLVVSGFALDRPGRLGVGAVFRIAPGKLPSVLLAESQAAADAITVRVPGSDGFYVMRCWDVSMAGRIIFADPSNGYRVIIGHPGDGESKTVNLTPKPTDDDNLKRLKESGGWKEGEYPRITNLYWLDEERFVVRPGAEARKLAPLELGVFDAYGEDGRSLGRHTLRCDFDPARDSHYIRNGLLIVIKGGKSANDAVYAQMAAMLKLTTEAVKPDADDAVDSIRIDVYDLNRHFDTTASNRN